MKKRFLGAAVAATGAILLFQSPEANANPDTYYLTCMNIHGYNVTNVTEALSWASTVQGLERADVSRSTIIDLLESQGADSAKANTIVDCAWKTWVNN